MHRADFRSLARQSSADLHQATRIARNDSLNTRALDRFDLLIENRHRDLRILHRESATKTTTRISVFEFDKLRATNVSNQSSRLALDIEIAQTVTCIVPG